MNLHCSSISTQFDLFPTSCTPSGIVLHLITLRHTHSVGSSTREIDPSKRTLPDSTHLQGTDLQAPAEFEPSISGSERKQDLRLRPHRRWYRQPALLKAFARYTQGLSRREGGGYSGVSVLCYCSPLDNDFFLVFRNNLLLQS
jgi:hypothetical protein